MTSTEELLDRVRETKPVRPSSHDFTDVDMGRRFAAQHDGKVLHVGLWHRDFVYDGTRWLHDVRGQANQLAKECVASLYTEAAEAVKDGDTGRADACTHAARSFLQMRRLNAMLDAARTEPNIAADAEQFDRHSQLLNVVNGTVDLRTSELQPHNPADFITMLAPFVFEPGAKAPVYEQFLADVYPDEELRAFIKRLFGYIAIGGNPERILPVQHGAGANGKTTQNEIIAFVLGDYAKVTPVSTLLAKRSDIPNDIAALRGVRFVYASESPEGRAFNESHIKAVSGNDRIAARHMRSEWFTFTPDFTCCLATNNKPDVRETTNAIWDRLLLIPYTTRFGEGGKPKDTSLMDKLKAEAPGILRWIVEGAAEYARDGLRIPESVRAATSAYRAEQDVVEPWIEDCCVLDPNGWESTGDLFDSLTQHNREHKLTQRQFAERLKTRGLTPKRARSGDKQMRGFEGIRLAYPGEDVSHVTGSVTDFPVQNGVCDASDTKKQITPKRGPALEITESTRHMRHSVTPADPWAAPLEAIQQARRNGASS